MRKNAHPAWSRPLALLVAALLAGPGCTRHYIVSVDELRKLDGYTHHHRGLDRPITATDGTTLQFSAANELWLLGPEPEVRGHFRSIRLTPTAFEGVLVGSSELLRADVASIQFAKVESVDAGKSLFLGGALTVGALALLYGYYLARPITAF